MKKLKEVIAVVAVAATAMAGLAPAQAVTADPQPRMATFPAPYGPPPASARHFAVGLSNIQHVVVIMMENRSFDSYFGTFPGAHGLPRKNGQFTTCEPDPKSGQCVFPFHDTSVINDGAGHGEQAFLTDFDSGKMDGFIREAERTGGHDQMPDEVMGYHTAAELPVYWGYAQNYVLQDHMFSPTTSWSAIAHLYMVSGWSAHCTTPSNPMTCSTTLDVTYGNPPPEFAWTDITWLLHANHVSWGYYVYPDNRGQEMAFEDPDEGAVPFQTFNIGSDWNPLPDFDDVKQDNELGDVQPGVNFETAATSGTLPAVSWVIPNFKFSDHPSSSVTDGQKFVSTLVNDVMSGPDWSSTAIFVSWDDWGGFYDQVTPPKVDAGGYGFRVPGLVISPWAKHGVVDHQVLSFDAYLKFIEDVFLNSQRIDPNTDGRPDSRPDVREDYPGLGDLANDFDFSQSPQPVTWRPRR